MAKPGAPHESMVEAFAKRLEMIFPDATLRFGKVVKPVGLKPDIYIEFSDGKKWAYEMVHGNHSTEKISSNHERYQKAGIFDIWILWDSLRPNTGHKILPEQGVFTYPNSTPIIYPLTKLQKTILTLQTDNVRYLYSFTLNPLGLEPETIQSNVMKTMMIGIDLYRFVNWNGEDFYPAESFYIPISSLQFEITGNFVIPEEETADDMSAINLELLGFDSSHMIVRNFVEQFEQLITTPEGLKQIIEAGLLQSLSLLTQEELVEIQEFGQSDAIKNITPFKGHISQEEAYQAFQSPEKMNLLVKDTQEFFTYLETSAIPTGFKKMISAIMGDGQTLTSIAGFMELLSQSKNFQVAIKAK